MHSKITRDLPPWVHSCNRFAAAVYTVARHNNGAILFPIYGVSECLWNRRAGRFSGKVVAFRDVAAFRSRSCAQHWPAAVAWVLTEVWASAAGWLVRPVLFWKEILNLPNKFWILGQTFFKMRSGVCSRGSIISIYRCLQDAMQIIM